MMLEIIGAVVSVVGDGGGGGVVVPVSVVDPGFPCPLLSSFLAARTCATGQLDVIVVLGGGVIIGMVEVGVDVALSVGLVMLSGKVLVGVDVAKSTVVDVDASIGRGWSRI
ncbi:MAG: hypothetical protein A2846_02010 [Candidatus Doudnabacteria bacterium RIFCSPHIGHO2_01_FULL_49_9]|uniref:Uncharacterized protein n=1 Tax=Candidatus Doudnabacteria bacterium RIFCSPHIGHO2_01_FULL_49_9 TaxID=1817827 RepID=A0A1F5P344_9BACT|nr:MAG: hypothetical protein A2846_02010 [Candidatus Doudnabacteria bacterium RIFCSPHIGHO2_01_FULL_49_9]